MNVQDGKIPLHQPTDKPMEDITRIERVEGFVGQLGKGRYSFHVSETRLRLPHTSPATLFISKDATPPKVFTADDLKKLMHRIASEVQGMPRDKNTAMRVVGFINGLAKGFEVIF